MQEPVSPAPTGREWYKETNEALCDNKKVSFSPCFILLCYQTIRVYTY